MQNMFTNYEDLSSVYVPNNEKAELENNKVINLSLPKKEYDHSGKFVGYSWNYGETLTIPYSANKVIYVEEDALVYDISGVSPSISTIGTFGQKAYNTADRKSWVCKTLDSSKYIWEEQDEFTYPENGKKPISIKFIQDVSDKFIEFSINNFRRENIYSITIPCAQEVPLIIDRDLSNKLIDGIYYCTLAIIGASDKYVDSEFIILIKSNKTLYESSTTNSTQEQAGAINA